MDCTLCNQAMQPDHRTTQMPCCPAEVHTQCYITYMSHSFNPNCFVCNTVLYHYIPNTDLPPPLDTPEYRAALRDVKKARAARNKGLLALNKSVRDVAIGFKAQTAPLISSLKAMKREAITTVKLTQGWREGFLTSRRYTAAVNRFTKDFALNTQTLRALRLWPRWYWKNRPAHIIRRKFRIRI